MARKTAASPAPDDRCPKCGRGPSLGPNNAPTYCTGTVSSNTSTVSFSPEAIPGLTGWWSYSDTVWQNPDGAKSVKPKKRKRRRK